MATPITMTLGQMFALTNGAACQPVYTALDTLYPGWTAGTSVDVFTYCEGMRGQGQAANIVTGILFSLNPSQQAAFINWGTGAIISHATNAYGRYAAMVTLAGQITSYLTSPDPTTQATLLSSSASIIPDPTIALEMCVANIFKKLSYVVANSTVNGDVLNDLFAQLKNAAALAGIPRTTVDGVALTKLEIIVGIADAMHELTVFPTPVEPNQRINPAHIAMALTPEKIALQAAETIRQNKWYRVLWRKIRSWFSF